MFSVVEGLMMLGERDQAAKFYTLVCEAIDTGTRMSFISSRLLETLAGIAAGAGERWDRAEEHFGTAMRQAQEIPMLLEQAEIQRFHAKALIERGRSADRERARSMLFHAIKGYEQFGMLQHAELTRSLLSGVN